MWCRALLDLTYLCVVSSPAAQTKIKAAPGQSVTLPCQAEGRGSVKVIEWTKDGLGENFVLLYRDSQFDQEQQHSSYKNRVELLDREMKNGNVSLVLKNVNTADNGRYDCRVVLSGIEATLDYSPISIIQLEVSSSESVHVCLLPGC